MRKRELDRALAAETGLSAADCRKVVDAFQDYLRACLASEGQVNVRGFGTFKTRSRGGRRFLDPYTGVWRESGPYAHIAFWPSRSLKLEIREELSE